MPVSTCHVFGVGFQGFRGTLVPNYSGAKRGSWLRGWRNSVKFTKLNFWAVVKTFACTRAKFLKQK